MTDPARRWPPRAARVEQPRRYERSRPGELVHADVKRAATAVALPHRAVAFFKRHGIRVERVLTDNGGASPGSYI